MKKLKIIGLILIAIITLSLVLNIINAINTIPLIGALIGAIPEAIGLGVATKWVIKAARREDRAHIIGKATTAIKEFIDDDDVTEIKNMAMKAKDLMLSLINTQKEKPE